MDASMLAPFTCILSTLSELLWFRLIFSLDFPLRSEEMNYSCET